MTRLQQFLRENVWKGEDGLDLYNRTYFSDIHPTITTRYSADNNKFIMETEKHIEPINEYPDGTSRTIKAQYAQTSSANLNRDDSFGATGATDGFRVRKLTPKECFSLMGVEDIDADKMIGVLSKSRCYQVAGNSIVVDVLEAIFRQLFIENTNTNQQTELF